MMESRNRMGMSWGYIYIYTYDGDTMMMTANGEKL